MTHYSKGWTPEKQRESQRQRRKYNPDDPIKHRAGVKKWAAEHPAATRAKNVIHNGIRAGRIFRPGVCSRCGEIARIEGHHPDYTKPEEVIWLCRICHEGEKSKPVNREEKK